MGNSESAAMAAQGGAIQERINKEKKRAKRLGCCCCWCNVAAVISFVVGIILLVYFAACLHCYVYAQISDPEDEDKKYML